MLGICLGVARGIAEIHWERVALNLDDTELPDHAGLAHQGNLIVPDGPPAYWSTLPIKRMRLGLQAAYGFIHVPDLIEPKSGAAKPTPGLPLETRVEAIELCLKMARDPASSA